MKGIKFNRYSQNRNRTISIAKSIEGSLSPNRLPSLHLKTLDCKGRKDRHFDKYYIRPTMRYRLKNQNPKANPESYQDETFIYKNLHNEQFWNWAHPLDAFRLKRQSNSISNKVNKSVLQKFRDHLESKAHRRVPKVVDQILSDRLQ